MASQNYKNINVSKSVKYEEKYDELTIQMVRRRFPWWIFLLLLPLLLLIKCHKDITVTCLEPDTKAPIVGVPVTMDYTAHYLWNEGSFMADEPVHRVQETDDKGVTVFRDCPCSVFSYIFYCMSPVTFTAKSDCHAAVDEEHNFHFTRNVELNMLPRREDLHVKLLDLETGDVLPGGTVVYKYSELGKEMTDSAKTDAEGVATLPNMRYCSLVSFMQGSCYGYADTTRVDVPCQDLVTPSDSLALRLRPIKERFTFFVKNKETKEPIPDATCIVTLTHPNGTKTTSPPIKTSTDGKGIAVYDDAFVLSVVAIHASKDHYGDGELEGGPWTVDQFIKQDDDVRTVWLEPEPYQVEFINVDSINGRPIPGVKNEITITDPQGNVTTATETSNSNGVFPVTAKENSRIEIVSTKNPGYHKKTTVIPSFLDKEKIPMRPVMVKVHFRTVKQDGSPLPGCSLSIKGSISGSLKPIGYTNAEFDVEMRKEESLSITASKNGFGSNSSTVNNTPASSLENKTTDIPLKSKPLNFNFSASPKGSFRECYDLEYAPRTFTFSWETCSVCTGLTVVDGNGKVLGRFGVNSPDGQTQTATYSPPTGSTTLTSSTTTVCVIGNDVNTCPCKYSISCP